MFRTNKQFSNSANKDLIEFQIRWNRVFDSNDTCLDEFIYSEELEADKKLSAEIALLELKSNINSEVN